MEQTTAPLATRGWAEDGATATGSRRVPAATERARVDGKLLVRGGQRLRVRGVTYGPFAPNAQGEQFPTSERVREDFAQMRGIGINSIRTYHLPPEWLMH